MTKIQFMLTLNEKLSEMPKNEIEERLTFYSEMIEDRIEEGLSEEEAVAAVGSVEEIAAQILEETSLLKIVQEKIKPKKRLRVWEIVLLAVGSPVWLSLLIGAIALVIALYAALWSVIISLWAAFAALAGSAVGGLVGGIALVCVGHFHSGLALFAAALVCAGLAIFLYHGCVAATKGAVLLIRKTVLWTKRAITGRRERND